MKHLLKKKSNNTKDKVQSCLKQAFGFFKSQKTNVEDVNKYRLWYKGRHFYSKVIDVLEVFIQLWRHK